MNKYGVPVDDDLFTIQGDTRQVGYRPDSQAITCLECGSNIQVIASIKAKRFERLAKRLMDHPNGAVDQWGNTLQVEISYPQYKQGRICLECWKSVKIGSHTRKDGTKRPTWKTPDGVEIIILFEGEGGKILEDGLTSGDGLSRSIEGDVVEFDGELVIIPNDNLNKIDTKSYRYFIQGVKGGRFNTTRD